MKYISGFLLTYNGKWRARRRYIGFEHGTIKKISTSAPSAKPVAKGLIIPMLINGHTHVGDAAIKGISSGTLEELVSPHGGLKFKVLQSLSENEIISGMNEMIEYMILSGIYGFCDFREFGLEGLRELERAIKSKPIDCINLGRPEKLRYNKQEVDNILASSCGIGVSSISDWDYSELKKLAEHIRKKKKILSLHVSERVREDIDKVLDLKPNLLIHMLKATESDLEIVADHNIPVVLCPRANMFFGMMPNIPTMIKKGLNLMLGTDNAMISLPDIFAEMECAFRISKFYEDALPENIFNMATINSVDALPFRGYSCNIEEREKANFIVLNITFNPDKAVDAIVKCSSKLITYIVRGEHEICMSG